MAKKRCWFVESKEYEMLIKGGNAGLRIIERNKKKQGTIYIQRDELAWLVGAAEEAMGRGYLGSLLGSVEGRRSKTASSKTS
jgi:Holliday junction resolvase